MAKEYVPIFFDWMEVTEELNAQEKGRLIDAIVTYAQGGDWQEQIKGNERYLFPAFKKQIDRSNEISETKANNGTKGGMQTQANASKPKQTQANASKRKQTQAKPSEEEKEEEKEEEYIKEKGKKESCRFLPPTVDDVKAYCQERNSTVDAERFVDFYSSKGWKVGSQPMKDWKAAVRTWEKRDGGKTVSAQAYSQRNYTEAALDAVGDDLMAEIRRGRMG